MGGLSRYDVKENLPYGTNSAVSLRMSLGTASKSFSSVDSSASDSAAVHSASLEHHIVFFYNTGKNLSDHYSQN